MKQILIRLFVAVSLLLELSQSRVCRLLLSPPTRRAAPASQRRCLASSATGSTEKAARARVTSVGGSAAGFLEDSGDAA
jgi:hypothetical protein